MRATFGISGLVVALTCNCLVFSQNLVPNPSFEEYRSCPTSVSQFDSIKYWYNPTMSNPDLFSTCAIGTQAGIPDNAFGHQLARTGSCYAHLGLFSTLNNAREYISVQLNASLLKDSSYCITFYVSAADTFYIYTDAVGVHFSEDSIHQNTNLRLPLIPHFKNAEFNYLSNKVSWSKVNGYYKALGGEKFITIGNFIPAEDVNYIGTTYFASSIYIDDISIVKCTQPAEENFLTLYPNPNQGNFHIHYGLIAGGNAELKVYDNNGKLIHKVNLTEGTRYKNIIMPNVRTGMYFWDYVVDGKRIDSGKMVVSQ